MFGAPCVAKVFNSLPLIRQCLRCHKLGHSIEKCNLSANIVICPICGGRHASNVHAGKCLTANLHTDLNCHCPLKCINCVSARLPGKGHLARDLSCPLRKKFQRDTNRTSDSSTEDLDRPMIVDNPVPPVTTLPSSQPPDDEQIVFKPTSPKRKSAARIDDTPLPSASKPLFSVPAYIQALSDKLKRWRKVTDPTYFHTLSVDKIKNISDTGRCKAFELGIDLTDLLQSCTNA